MVAALIIAALPALAAVNYRKNIGEDLCKPNASFSYCENFLSMMFAKKKERCSNRTWPSFSKALDLIFLLHADHEQNCSTSTCRMIASGGANPFASLAGAVSALWGPLHGGAHGSHYYARLMTSIALVMMEVNLFSQPKKESPA